ncbi:MAG: malate dehydrogenase [Betaproteobacteria bacterium]|nr:malate dehydrogenase [Betaproteobacteria bacterium]
MTRKKIALIGAGNVGGALAHLLAHRALGDVVLVDAIDGLAAGKALDIAQGTAISATDVRISGGIDPAGIAGADVVVVSAAAPPSPGASRDDMVRANCRIIQQVATDIRTYAPRAFVICISNPLDAMVAVLQQVAALPYNRIVGMAGVLDSARLRFYLAAEFGVSVADVTALALGGHGYTVPLLRYSAIAGIPVTELLAMGWSSRERIEAILQRTRAGGVEIGKLLKTASAHFATASGTVDMIESHLADRKRTMPCSAHITAGQYGQPMDMFIGVPVVIGALGVERVIEIRLDAEEQAAFDKSAAAVRALLEVARVAVAQ